MFVKTSFNIPLKEIIVTSVFYSSTMLPSQRKGLGLGFRKCLCPCSICEIIKLLHISVKISLKRVEMNFCPGSKNSIIGKTQRKPEDMTELSTNYVTFTKFH
jgi:hypothetical protein